MHRLNLSLDHICTKEQAAWRGFLADLAAGCAIVINFPCLPGEDIKFSSISGQFCRVKIPLIISFNLKIRKSLWLREIRKIIEGPFREIIHCQRTGDFQQRDPRLLIPVVEVANFSVMLWATENLNEH